MRRLMIAVVGSSLYVTAAHATMYTIQCDGTDADGSAWSWSCQYDDLRAASAVASDCGAQGGNAQITEEVLGFWDNVWDFFFDGV